MLAGKHGHIQTETERDTHTHTLALLNEDRDLSGSGAAADEYVSAGTWAADVAAEGAAMDVWEGAPCSVLT